MYNGGISRVIVYYCALAIIAAKIAIITIIAAKIAIMAITRINSMPIVGFVLLTT